MDAGVQGFNFGFAGAEGVWLCRWSSRGSRSKALSEEHGILQFDPTLKLFEIGQRIEVIPNHVCVVSNMLDQVHLVRDGDIETVEVAARGCVL